MGNIILVADSEVITRDDFSNYKTLFILKGLNDFYHQYSLICKSHIYQYKNYFYLK